MKNKPDKVKITLKYDSGKEKATIEIDSSEMESFLERGYQHRITEAKDSEYAPIRKLTPEEYAQSLNRESYNNWRKHNRHKSGYVKNIYAEDERNTFVSPVELLVDNSLIDQFEESIELEVLKQKLYGALPRKQADLIWMVAIEEIPIAEIAAKEGVTTRAIYLRLETAKNNFKKIFPHPSLF